MSDWITGLNALAWGWESAMGRAAWQGAIALGIAWAVCRLLPNLPGSSRCWVWRLAFLKLLTALFWTELIPLPILTADRPPAVQAAPWAAPHGLTALSGIVSPPPLVPAISPSNGPSVALSQPRPALPSRSAGLLILWLVGVGGWMRRIEALRRGARRLRRRGTALEDEAIAGTLAELCGRLRLRRIPELVSCQGGGPRVIGTWHPAILLPVELRRRVTAAELRLVIAHELAHLKRRDLLWGWLPVVAQGLFFFHPLVWIAARESRLAQEMACDEMAVGLTEAAPGDYGEMLVNLAASCRGGTWGSSAAMGLEPGIALERRLAMLQYLRTRSRRPMAPATIGMVLAIAGLAPWQVTAQTAPPIAKLQTLPSAPSPVSRPDPAPEPKVGAIAEQKGAGEKPVPAPSKDALAAPARQNPEKGTPAPKVADADRSAPAAGEAGVVWEDMLLLEATRYLRLSRSQLQQMLGLAAGADERLTRLRGQEDQSLAALQRIALDQREALLAGRSGSAREQANALSIRAAMQQRRAQTEIEVVNSALPELARMLTPAQAERAFLLAQGLAPEGEAGEPALLDLAAGFVVGPKGFQPGKVALAGGKGEPGGPVGSLAQQLLEAQQGLTASQQALMKLNMMGDPGKMVSLKLAAEGAAADQRKKALAAEAAAVDPKKKELVIQGSLPAKQVPVMSDEEARAHAAEKMEELRQRFQEQIGSAASQVMALRRQLFHNAVPGSGASVEDRQIVLAPLARRLFLSPRLKPVLTDRLRATD